MKLKKRLIIIISCALFLIVIYTSYKIVLFNYYDLPTINNYVGKLSIGKTIYTEANPSINDEYLIFKNIKLDKNLFEGFTVHETEENNISYVKKT